MKFLLDKTHRHHFETYGYIEFDEVINEAALAEIKKQISAALTKRLSLSTNDFSSIDPDKAMKAGRDLWRDAPALKNLLKKPGLPALAAEIFLQNGIRLGYDQLLIMPNSNYPSACYSEIKQASLEQLSAMQGVFGGMVLCLNKAETSFEESLLPSKAANVTFFSAELPLLGKELFASFQDGSYLLVAFCKELSVYISNQDDPNCSALRAYEYNYGDRLNDRTHPMLLRLH